MPWVDVCAVDDVVEERINAFDAAGQHILVHKHPEGYTALDGICTHQEVDLGLGFYLDGKVTCPSHTSQFDLRTGEVIGPPAEEALRLYPVKVEGGRILVDLPGAAGAAGAEKAVP